MNLIQTKSFKLAIYSKGDESSSRLALVLPGKLDTKDYPHMHSHVEYLSKKGFYAVSFDPPGTWESPGDIKLYTMTNYAKTVNELIEYFGNKPTFVMGHSFGGGITLLVGVNNPNVISFASIMSRGSYMPEHHGEDYPDQEWKARGYRISTRDLPKNLNQKKEFKLPYSFLEDRINYDMSGGLSKSEKPKLLILGKYDELVEPESVRKVYEMAAAPKELFELDFGHDYRKSKVMIDKVNNVIGDFLDKYEAPLANAIGIFSSRFVGAKSSEAKNSSHLSTNSQTSFSAKEDKV